MLSGQMSMFKEFCFDTDINQTVDKLDKACRRYSDIVSIKKKWSIWKHVPQHGYRLSYIISTEGKPHDTLINSLCDIVDWAKSKKIEISVHPSFIPDSDWEGGCRLYVFSTFMDNRKRLK